jgi:hypothetical protein
LLDSAVRPGAWLHHAAPSRPHDGADTDSGPAPITIAAQRRELLTDLKPCLEIPIKGGAIGNTQQQWVQPVQQQLLRHWHFNVSKPPKSQHFANLSHHIDTYETTNA